MAFVLDPTDDYRTFHIDQLISSGFTGADTLSTVLTTFKAAVVAAGTGGVCPLCGGGGKVTKDKVTQDPNDSSITITCPPASDNAISGCNGWGYLVTQPIIKVDFKGGAQIG